MKQSVWILNSSLLILCIMSQLFLFMIQRAVPRRAPITPGEIVAVKEQQINPVDITKIYQQDLFGTYEIPAPQVKSFIEDTVAPMPAPPKIIFPEVPVEKAPTFFAPLDVVLKGVIFVKDDPASCIAIVQLKKTKEEKNYLVGDLIEDAQILKILSNRIIIIRSNGQQETLYLREEDAISDFNAEAKFSPKSIVENAADNHYTVNVDEFVKRVHNLGEFISLLDLSTVYKRGKSFGCRVGRIEKDSLGALLGFAMDDIIVKIDDFYVDDLANRIQLYDHIVQRHAGDVIEVVINRGQDTIVMLYGLIDNVTKSITFTPHETHEQLLLELSKHEALEQQTQDDQDQIYQDQNAATDNSVVIQNISPEQQNEIGMDAPASQDVMDVDAMPVRFAETPVISSQKRVGLSRKAISSQVEDPFGGQSSDSAAAKQSLAERHRQKLEREFNKDRSLVQKRKDRDKDKMRRGSRGMISNGFQQSK